MSICSINKSHKLEHTCLATKIRRRNNFHGVASKHLRYRLFTPWQTPYPNRYRHRYSRWIVASHLDGPWRVPKNKSYTPEVQHSPWKSMVRTVRRWISFWDDLFSGAMRLCYTLGGYSDFWVCILSERRNNKCFKMYHDEDTYFGNES